MKNLNSREYNIVEEEIHNFFKQINTKLNLNDSFMYPSQLINFRKEIEQYINQNK